MQKITPEQVKEALTPEVRANAMEELEENKNIDWVHKQDFAYCEIFVASVWLREKFVAAGVDGRELGCRVWDAMREMRKVGPYIGGSEAWNLLVDGELSSSAKMSQAFGYFSDQVAAAIRNAGKPMN